MGLVTNIHFKGETDWGTCHHVDNLCLVEYQDKTLKHAIVPMEDTRYACPRRVCNVGHTASPTTPSRGLGCTLTHDAAAGLPRRRAGRGWRGVCVWLTV